MADPILPILRHAVLCSHVEHDRDGRVYCLIEPMHTLAPAPGSRFPLTAPEMFVYVQLEDAVGRYRVSVEVRTEGGIVLRQSDLHEIAFDGTTDRILPHELALRLIGLAFPGPGRDDFVVKCNHASLHDRPGAAPTPFLRVLSS